MKLRGRTVLVTGGGSGIGLGLATELAKSGNTVIICGRNPKKLADAKASVPELHARTCDLSSPVERERLAAHLIREFPALDVVINNAAVLNVMNLAADGPETLFRKIHEELTTNAEAPMHLALLLLDQLRSRPEALIVNVTSGVAYAPRADTPAYSASKAALRMMTQSLRFQLAHTNVRVVDLSPPPVLTEMSSTWQGSTISAENFAMRAIRGIEAGKEDIRVGMTGVFYWLVRLSPWLAFRVLNPRKQAARGGELAAHQR